MYTMDKQNFPVEYLTGESQIITCDFIQINTVNKANYLAFIPLLTCMKNNLVSIGRYIKKNGTIRHKHVLVSPSKTVVDGKKTVV